jgi:hypothetical protein
MAYASFKTRIGDLTGFASTDDTALSDWMNDGIRELINAFSNNYDLLAQCATTQSFTSQAVGSETSASALNTGKILTVSMGSYPCRKIDPRQKFFAGDSSAFASSQMEKASTSDPVYYIESGYINALPSGNTTKYSEVQYPVADLTAGTSGIGTFPDEAEHLVVLYASTKALQQMMSNKSSVLPSDVAMPAVPDIPTISTISYTDATNEDALVDVISVPSKIDISSNAPDFSAASLAPDFAKVTAYVETDEDVELASSKLQQIQSQISEFNANLQKSTNVFNKDNVRYQMEFQEEVTKVNQDLQAELERFRTKASIAQFNKQQDQALNLANAAKQVEDLISDNSSKMQKYASELQAYQAEVSSTIQNYNAKIQKQVTNYQWLVGQYQNLMADYQRGLQLLTGSPAPRGQ